MALSDSLVKVAAWTHNTSVNRLGYSPLQLVTGQAVMVPGLTTGNEATKSMTDSEVVRRTMENLMKITSKFSDSDMWRKLKECQDVRVQEYQHREDYMEGDKVWFQPLNGNAWIGPALVVCQRGQSVYLHTHGDLKKIAACRVKPYRLVERDEQSATSTTGSGKAVMLEDGLEDMECLFTDNFRTDVIGANYLKIAQSVSFSDMCTYTVELLTSEH